MKNKWLIAGILILILLLLFTAIISLSWQGLEQIGQGGVRYRAFSNDVVSAEADEDLRFPVNGPANLDIRNDIGNITVTVGSDDEIVIKTHKTAWGSNQANAETALENLKVTANQEDNSVTVRVEPIDVVYVFAFRARPDSVVFTITVPADTTVITQSNVGDITLSDTNGDANLQTDFGDVSVANTEGVLTVETNSGKISVQQARANGQVIDLKSEFGAITLAQVSAGDLLVHSNSGEIELEGVDAAGDITLGSEFGRIHFKSGKAAMLSVEANSGGIVLTDLVFDNPLISKTEFGDITLLNVDAPSYDLESNSGKVSLDGASGNVKAHSEFGDIDVTNGESVTLDLQTNSGAVEYSGSLGTGPHILKTEFGNIHLTIPEDTSLSVELETEFGRVKSDLTIALSGGFSEDRLVGTINGGGELLTASTNSGNITISILNLQEKK
jgi:DUF4097 and DUF4098 domain-containing protein YvlB